MFHHKKMGLWDLQSVLSVLLTFYTMKILISPVFIHKLNLIIFWKMLHFLPHSCTPAKFRSVHVVRWFILTQRPCTQHTFVFNKNNILFELHLWPYNLVECKQAHKWSHFVVVVLTAPYLVLKNKSPVYTLLNFWMNFFVFLLQM